MPIVKTCANGGWLVAHLQSLSASPNRRADTLCNGIGFISDSPKSIELSYNIFCFPRSKSLDLNFQLHYCISSSRLRYTIFRPESLLAELKWIKKNNYEIHFEFCKKKTQQLFLQTAKRLYSIFVCAVFFMLMPMHMLSHEKCKN